MSDWTPDMKSTVLGMTTSDPKPWADGMSNALDRLAGAVTRDPKLDPLPWFRWCDSEIAGAPPFERYAKRGNHTEFDPRPEFSQNPADYGIEGPMSDTTVEEIRDDVEILTSGLASANARIAALLTKLDDAERERDDAEVAFKGSMERCIDAVERERALIAGIREAQTLSEYLVGPARAWGYGGTAENLDAILSALLPTEEAER